MKDYTDVIHDKLENGMETLEKSNSLFNEIIRPTAEWIADHPWSIPGIIIAWIILKRLNKK